MATVAHCCYVFDVLEAHLQGRKPKSLREYQDSADDVVSTLRADSRHPLFVTYNTLRPGKEKRLRGCIGTFASNPLEETLRRYALVAALEDTRFSPIKTNELEGLEAAVSILTDFEEIEDPYDWKVGTHGLQVHFMYRGRGRSATFLPDVAAEQGWTQDDTLEHLFRKGGWDGAGRWQDLKIDLERYQSTKADISYAEYARMNK